MFCVICHSGAERSLARKPAPAPKTDWNGLLAACRLPMQMARAPHWRLPRVCAARSGV